MLQEYERHLDTKQVKQKLRHQLRRKVWEYFDTWKDRGRKQGLLTSFLVVYSQMLRKANPTFTN